MPKRSDERIEFLTDLLSCAIEGGVQYWAEIEYVEETPLIVRVYDKSDGYFDDPVKSYEVDIDTVAKGIAILTNDGQAHSLSGREYWKQFLLSNRTNGEEGDYDADIADNILQAGIFGEVIYG